MSVYVTRYNIKFRTRQPGRYEAFNTRNYKFALLFGLAVFQMVYHIVSVQTIIV